MAELGLKLGLSYLLDTREDPGTSSLTDTLSYFSQTTLECITNRILRLKTLRPREVTQEQVVNKLADLGKLGLGPRSACLQSRLGSGSQSVHPRGLLEKPRQRAGSQHSACLGTRNFQKPGFSSLCLDQAHLSILALSLVPRAVASSWSI